MTGAWLCCVVQENEIAKLRHRLDDAESRSVELSDENTELKREASSTSVRLIETGVIIDRRIISLVAVHTSDANYT